ncbi:MAG: DUF2380 domain-containing protein [Methylococcales bacterium]|nr:DUF2380 domain-containing protein [Methylococcales bacterium]
MVITSILFFCVPVSANSKIVILDFELNDITSLPRTKEELKRTSSIKPILEQSLEKIGHYNVIKITNDEQKKANAGFGYLFRFHDVAAKLGQQRGAEWIIVGQHSKPSFLYSYLIVYLINAKTEKAIARYAIELKGNHQKVTQHAVNRLVKNINESILH